MPSPEPAVIRIMREFKASLLRREAGTLREMLRRWLEVEASLDGRMTGLAEEIARARASGQITTQGQVLRLERYQALLAQVRREVEQYQAWLTGRVTTWQREAGALGVEQAQEAIRAAGVRGAFNRLPVSAAEYLAGLSADGAPVFDLLRGRAITPEAVDGLTKALTDGVTQGWNPRKTASRMKDGLAQGLEKARVIARTEQMRVYRAASDRQYSESKVVRGKVRVAAKDSRTCLACLARDGEFMPLERPMYDHPQGRCTAAPVIIGIAPLSWQTGAQWFATLSAAQQRDMMGDRLYEAWAKGKGFDFAALARSTQHSTWGEGLRVATMDELGVAA